MPWKIVKGGGCGASKPWAVVKKSDGSTVGCHASEESAKAQLAALNANEPKHNLTIEEARKVLGWS